MAPNPYTPYSPPSLLAGREHEVSVARQVLAPVISTGHAASGALIIHGARGVGKTSVLREVSKRAQLNDGFVSVWVSAAKNQPFLPSLATTIATTLEATGVVKRGGWSLDKVGLELSLGVAKVSASASKAERPAAVWGIGDLERLLREVARLCRAHGGGNGAGLLLFIDELHAIRNDELAVLLNAIQNISHDELFSPPFALMAAGLPSIRGIATKAATFGERSRFLEIGNLSVDAADQALRLPAEAAGVTYTREAAARLADEFHGYPYFVQLLGFHTWEVAAKSGAVEIDLGVAEAGIAAAQKDIHALYTARLASATKGERDLIAAVARLAGDSTVRRADVAAEMGKTTQAISDVRSRLMDKAIIVEAERGYIRFTLPGFARYVIDQLG